MVEVKRIVEEFGVGRTVQPENIEALRSAIEAVGAEDYSSALKAAQEALTWEKEQIPLKAFYGQFL